MCKGPITPHPRFDEALAALDAGDVERLRHLLASDPSLVHARTNLEPSYGYFTGATLLHHAAGNPRDNPLPANIVEIARLLLDAGADVDALTLGPAPSNSPGARGATTMGLVCPASRPATPASPVR
jgi:ankyrin repeat protein